MPAGRAPKPGGRPLEQAGRPQGGDGRTDERTDGISPHSTGLRPLPGPLPKKLLLYDALKKLAIPYRSMVVSV